MAKEKSKENKVWGVTSVDRHYFFQTDESGYSPLLEKVRDTWEALRRCEEYLTLCEGVEFHQSGIADSKWAASNTEKYNEINKRANQLGIKQVLDPRAEFYSLQRDIAVDIIGPNPVEVKAHNDQITNLKDEESWRKRFLEDDRFLTVKIDITQRNKDITDLITMYLNYYRDRVGFQGKRHTGKMECWQVYDLIKEGCTHKEIIEKMWPDEYQKAIDEGDSKLAEKYNQLVEKYRKQGLEDWDERAYKEAYGKCEGSLINTLYMRVKDNNNAAEKKWTNLD